MSISLLFPIFYRYSLYIPIIQHIQHIQMDIYIYAYMYVYIKFSYTLYRNSLPAVDDAWGPTRPWGNDLGESQVVTMGNHRKTV